MVAERETHPIEWCYHFDDVNLTSALGHALASRASASSRP
jgi:hypothetical protein